MQFMKEIKIKEKQGVNIIFLSSIFKENKNYLGINKFKLLSNLTNKKIIALGGISKKKRPHKGAVKIIKYRFN